MCVFGAVEQSEPDAERRHAILKRNQIKDFFLRKLRASLSQLFAAWEADQIGSDVLSIRLWVDELDVIANGLVGRPAHHFNRVAHVERQLNEDG